jgi:hypothetical protein
MGWVTKRLKATIHWSEALAQLSGDLVFRPSNLLSADLAKTAVAKHATINGGNSDGQMIWFIVQCMIHRSLLSIGIMAGIDPPVPICISNPHSDGNVVMTAREARPVQPGRPSDCVASIPDPGRKRCRATSGMEKSVSSKSFPMSNLPPRQLRYRALKATSAAHSLRRHLGQSWQGWTPTRR